MENHEMDSVETVQIPEFGRVKVIRAKAGFRCVDPRASTDGYPVHESGYMGVPGGTKGIVMTLMGALSELSVHEAVDYVFSWEKTRERVPTFHTADHVHGTGTGCGHEDNASKEDNEELYGLKAHRVREMTAYIKWIVDTSSVDVDVCMLTGDHAEVGVLEVVSDKSTVEATDDKGNSFFRFDKTRHDREIEHLSTFLAEKGVDVKSEMLLASAEKQRNATLILLAKGKPLYRIDLRKERVQKNIVEHVGYIGQEPSTPDLSAVV